MEKKSLFDEGGSAVQPYTPVQFEDSEFQKKAGKKQEISEEEIQERVRAMEKQGYDKGHSAGYSKGLTDGQKEIAGRIARLDAITAELEKFKDKKINELLPDVIRLSMEIAGKIVHKEIELDRNIILFTAKEAVKKVGEKEENIIIKVNPLDYEVMLSSLGLLKEQSGIKNISIEPLAAISPGGCYIETQTGEVDARIEEQVKEVGNAIGAATDREM